MTNKESASRHHNSLRARLLGGFATWPASPLAVMTIRTHGAILALYGLTTILQGEGRWSGPAFDRVQALAPQLVWGSAYIVLGICTLVGSLLARIVLRNVGLLGGVVCLIALASQIDAAAVANPAVSYAGTVLFYGYATGMAIVSFAREGR